MWYDDYYEDDEPWYMDCPKGHGEQEVVDAESFTGFAGGKSYMYTLACGHVVLDEEDDVRAAY